ncbi:MAG: hypothetical protein K8U57_06920 [Planctomycetes bacterium]|nr:hypothetical protein [Planctomycetota bacterium]
MNRCTLSALLVVATAGPVGANAGPPASGGQVAGEPVGVRHIRIVRETLSIDLRPVARNEKAVIDVVYQLQNDAPRRPLDLLFATGSNEIAGFVVLFDGQPVPVTLASETAIPDSWKPPRETPGFGGGSGIEYAPGTRPANPVKLVAFSLDVPPGAHTLVVKYTAAVGTNWRGHPLRYHQFAYVLAPARSWEGFGGLDVAVYLPENWAATTTPDLIREGDILRGSFPNVPADSIAITFRASDGSYRSVIEITRWLFGSVAFGGLLVAMGIGRWRGRRAARAVHANSTQKGIIWPWALGLGLVWSVGFFATGLLAVYAPEAALPEGQAGGTGYTQIFEAIGITLLAPTVAVFGFLVTYITGLLVQRINLRAARTAHPELGGSVTGSGSEIAAPRAPV